MERCEARDAVCARWGGSGEGVREGWVEERAVRRGVLVRMGCRAVVLG